MSDLWNFYALRVDNEPASIFVDLGIAKDAPLASFPNMAYLRVRMNNPRPDGLSSQEEFDTLVEIEDRVAQQIKLSDQSIYVGRNTSSGNRDFYFYTRDHSIEDTLREIMANWPDYAFQMGERVDEDWSTYWQFLYPSPADFQRMGNRDVVNQLLDHDDQIDIPRKIDHFAVFVTPDGRDAFARHLTLEGYAISETTDAGDDTFKIAFDKVDRPDQIDDVTIDLLNNARQNGGEYDGWGCTIVN